MKKEERGMLKIIKEAEKTWNKTAIFLINNRDGLTEEQRKDIINYLNKVDDILCILKKILEEVKNENN